MNLEQVRPEALVGQAGDDCDQLARLRSTFSDSDISAGVKQVSDLGHLVVEHGLYPENQTQATHRV